MSHPSFRLAQSMLGFVTIVRRDLRSESQSRRVQKGRLTAGLVAGVILIALVLLERRTGAFNVNRLLGIVPLSGVGPIALFIIGLNRAANLLTVERREGTLPLLLLTRLTGYDVVLGKLLQALVIELTLFLAIIPALVLPWFAAGFRPHELWLVVLGCLNVLFFALALGLLVSVFGEGTKMTSGCLLLLLPWLICPTAVGFLLPVGRIREALIALQWFNPCESLTHVQATVAGMRPSSYWTPLIASHALGWCFLALAGLALPRACRWHAGIAANPLRRLAWWQRVARPRSSSSQRTRLLNRNPMLWVAGRERWPTIQLWLLLILPALGWGWLVWLAWVGRGLNLTIVLVVAAAVTWLTGVLFVVPREASRRLVEDRNSGALELILCTPLDTRGVVRGQWLCLMRRYRVPVVLVMVSSTILMIGGYTTFGFGGMLDPEDRPVWLFSWLAGIVLLPVSLTALCWVAMRRALLARTSGEASGIAFLQVLGFPGFAFWSVYSAVDWAGWRPDWEWNVLLLSATFVVTPVVLAWRARRILLQNLRDVTANQASAPISHATDLRWFVRGFLKKNSGLPG